VAFPPGFLEELRSRISLFELVGRSVQLVRRGREYAGLCPFHNEKSPSFYVVEDKSFFHCFGCGAHGDAIGFVMRADNLDFIEAVEKLAGVAGLAVPKTSPQDREQAQRQKTLLEALEAAAAFYEAQLWLPAGRRARDYLDGRGLDRETIRRFRLGWAPDDRQALRRALAAEFPQPLLVEAGLLRVPSASDAPYDYFRGRVIFPIGDRSGRIIAFGGRTIGDDQPKYLNSPDTAIFEKGRVLYGWAAARANLAREPDPAAPGVVVAEGYMDVIALHRAGFPTAVAPLGTALTEFQLEELWRLAPEPVLCLDADKAGGLAALRTLNKALPLLRPGHSLRFAVLPLGEDPDSLIRAAGRDAFAARLARARPLSQFWWDCELQAWPTDTPERRAYLERRLMDGTDAIADRTVRAEYRRFFRQRLFALAGPVRPAARRGARTKADVPKSGSVLEPPPRQPRLPGRIQREILFHMLLRYPAIIDEIAEEFAALEVPELELDKLRRAIFEVAASLPGLDAEALQQHLVQNGFAATVQAVLSPSVDMGFLVRRSDPSSVRNQWAHVIKMLVGQDHAALTEATENLINDVSAENWARLLATRERADWEGLVGEDQL
jgi:DNA primase